MCANFVYKLMFDLYSLLLKCFIKNAFFFFCYCIFDPPPVFFLFFKLFLLEIFFPYFLLLFEKKMTTIPPGSMSKIHKSVYSCYQREKIKKIIIILIYVNFLLIYVNITDKETDGRTKHIKIIVRDRTKQTSTDSDYYYTYGTIALMLGEY